MVVCNNHYDQYFNTVLVIPISTSAKYCTLEKYVKSPIFIMIDKKDIRGTVLLQHIRVIDPTKRLSSQVVATLPQQEIKHLSNKVQQFF